jgi:peptidoglycan hydrolase-like protein with peptidoglycan-binding domain
MSGNRLSWILVAIVVVVVGVLVFRTVSHDASTRSDAGSQRTQAAPERAPGSSPKVGANPDSVRAAKANNRQPNSVERAQAVLKERGFYSGPISGSYNPEVAEAIKKFQKSVGMKPDGYLNEKTYTALGIEIRAKRK